MIFSTCGSIETKTPQGLPSVPCADWKGWRYVLTGTGTLETSRSWLVKELITFVVLSC